MNGDDLISRLRRAGAQIGDQVFCGPDVYVELEFAPLLTIENGVVIARGVSLILHDSGLNNVAAAPLRFGRIILRENCYLGANTTVLCGVEIGARALVGAASLVTRSIPADHVAFGSPARVHGTVVEFAARQSTRSDDLSRFLLLPPWRERRSPEQSHAALAQIDGLIRQLASPEPGEPLVEPDPASTLDPKEGVNPVVQEQAEITREDGTMSDHSPQPFFKLDADSETLRNILAKIDQNLIMRPLLGAPAEAGEGPPPVLTLNLPDIQAINRQLSELQRLHSLVYLTDTGAAGRVAKQAINPIIKVVSRKQILFNRELIDVLSQLSLQVPSLQQLTETVNDLLNAARRADQTGQAQAERLHQLEVHAETIAREGEQLQTVRDRLAELETLESRSAQAITELRPWVEALTREKTNHDTWLKRLTEDKESHAHWLNRLSEIVAEVNQRFDMVSASTGHAEDMAQSIVTLSAQNEAMAKTLTEQTSRVAALSTELHGVSLWVATLNERIASMAKEARNDQDRRAADLTAPRIIDTHSYSLKIAACEGALRLNLGAGDKAWDGYINIDAREMAGIDVVADVANLPYAPGSVSEIASAHVVEHFREHYFRKTLLPYWKSLLRPGGTLRIICPDWDAMQERLQSGQMTWETYKLLTFGGQDYVGNDHFAMYTPRSLSALLSDEGFVDIQVLASDRMNDICPEMELIGKRL